MKFVVNPKMYNHPDPSINRLVETKDIVDYPVSEAQMDSLGKPVWDEAAGTYRITGKTLEVTILRGKGAWLEDYVAEILLDRYDYLREDTDNQKPALPVEDQSNPQTQEVVQPSAPVEQAAVTPDTQSLQESDKPAGEEPVKIAGVHGCSQCGQRFKTVVNLGTHLGAKHPEFLSKK